MVYITHIENVGCFYITKTDAIIISLNEEIQKQYKVGLVLLIFLVFIRPAVL